MIVFRWGLSTTRLVHAKTDAAGRCGRWCGRDGWESAEPIASAASQAGAGFWNHLGASWASAGKSGDTGGVAGMRITLSGAMRARDVSRPTDEQVAAAVEREARVARVGRQGGSGRARGPASATSAVAALGGATSAGATSAGATSDSPALGGAESAGAAAGRSPSGSVAAGSPTPGSPTPGSSASAALDMPNGGRPRRPVGITAGQTGGTRLARRLRPTRCPRQPAGGVGVHASPGRCEPRGAQAPGAARAQARGRRGSRPTWAGPRLVGVPGRR